MPVRDYPAGGLNERGRAWLAEGRPDGVRPRLAATVELLRDGADGLEVFVIERVPTMAFAPSMVVFPGGGVDERDAQTCVTWGTGRPEALGLEGDDHATERSVLTAACRELYEECGILLASPLPDGGAPGEPVDAASAPDELADPARYAEERRLLDGKQLSLADLALREGLGVRADLLSPRARWCTPHFEERRYDTFFFAARVPEGQEPDGLTTEAASSRWVRPTDVLESFERGETKLLPPTYAAMEDLARFPDAASALAAAPVVTLVLPTFVDLAAEGAGEGYVIRVETAEPAGTVEPAEPVATAQTQDPA